MAKRAGLMKSRKRAKKEQKKSKSSRVARTRATRATAKANQRVFYLGVVMYVGVKKGP